MTFPLKCAILLLIQKRRKNQLGCMFTFENPVLFRRVSVTNTWVPSDSCFDYFKRHSSPSKDTLVSKLIIITFKPKAEYSIFLYNKKNPTICADVFYVESKYLPEFLEKFKLT